MAIIEPIREDVQNPKQIKKNSKSLRLWHWLNVIVITGSLLTVLLNFTLLKTRKNAAFIKTQLTEAGATVTAAQSKSVAHALSDRVWEIHIYFGYALSALFAFRLLLEIFQLADQKFIRKIKFAYNQYFIIKKNRKLARHELAVKALYAVFYLLILVMVTTGLTLAFEDDLPKISIIHSIKEVHGFTMYLILAFITVHVVGVILAEHKPDGNGITSDMINGGKA